MRFKNTGDTISKIIGENLDTESQKWLFDKIAQIIAQKSVRELYLTYSLCNTKIAAVATVKMTAVDDSALKNYLVLKEANLLEISRVCLLAKVLDADRDFFKDKVANLIQVADTKELETFLKYLILLPDAGYFQHVAVEALRTNIATIFDAISLHNPYPAQFFNEQQWNQMYLKAAFMQRDLGEIIAIDERANQALAKIISDYAHERWAASRDIDPEIWRPTTKYLDNGILADIHRLLKSENIVENRAAALCCFHSGASGPLKLLQDHPSLRHAIENDNLTWENFKN
ncbi:MAG: EboA domain-containing protein [Bacteroidota bacterium]